MTIADSVANAQPLPELHDHLTSVKPTDAWPFELRLLRSRLDGGLSLAQGLGACTSFPVAVVRSRIDTSKIGLGDLVAAASELERLCIDSQLARATHDPALCCRRNRLWPTA